eukprot:5493494-Pleurochrysis_carterae.AAC.2
MLPQIECRIRVGTRQDQTKKHIYEDFVICGEAMVLEPTSKTIPDLIAYSLATDDPMYVLFYDMTFATSQD